MNDDTIVTMFWNRDENAISAISEKYGAYCLTISKNILGNSEDAKECVNDAYMSVWSTIPPHRPAQLSTYLGKIVRNLSINLHKKNRAQKRKGKELNLVLDELSEVLSDAKTLDEKVNYTLLVQSINAFLDGQNEIQRKIFVSRYWYAESVKSIAKRFKMTENNVSVTLNRVRTQLRSYLEEGGFEL